YGAGSSCSKSNEMVVIVLFGIDWLALRYVAHDGFCTARVRAASSLVSRIAAPAASRYTSTSVTGSSRYGYGSRWELVAPGMGSHLRADAGRGQPGDRRRHVDRRGVGVAHPDLRGAGAVQVGHALHGDVHRAVVLVLLHPELLDDE